MSASMNYILIYVINLAKALIGCQAHPLKGMHNSLTGRPLKPFIMGQGRRRERRRRGEGGREGQGYELEKEGKRVGWRGDERRDLE